MESNWRWNVYASGWTGGPYPLVLRLKVPVGPFNCLAGRQFGSAWALYLGTSDLTGYVPTWGLFDFPVGGRWWNGSNLVPDEPAVPWV